MGFCSEPLTMIAMRQAVNLIRPFGKYAIRGCPAASAHDSNRYAHCNAAASKVKPPERMIK